MAKKLKANSRVGKSQQNPLLDFDMRSQRITGTIDVFENLLVGKIS